MFMIQVLFVFKKKKLIVIKKPNEPFGIGVILSRQMEVVKVYVGDERERFAADGEDMVVVGAVEGEEDGLRGHVVYFLGEESWNGFFFR